MIVIEKVKDRIRVRCAFIGFIKHNFTRRTLMCITWPFVVIITININLIMLVPPLCYCIFQAFATPLNVMKSPIWESEVWEKPRVKK